MNKNAVLVVVVLVIIAAVAAWYFLWRGPAGTAIPSTLPEQGQAPGIGGDIYGKVAAPANPATQVPETNPLKATVNPYSDAYKNPFGQ